MADQQSSELLRVLGQLDEAAWAETLLPLLRANKSAGSFALACKQLRQLCQGNQRELKLTDRNCRHLGPLELDAFRRPFPACSSVAFTAWSEDEFMQFMIVLPLLARLPRLHSLQLNVATREADEPIPLVAALQLLRLQLPQLRSLQLERRSSGYAINSYQCWEVLGAATQLTKLAIAFTNDEYVDAYDKLSLEPLSSLQPLGSSLQHLELTAEQIDLHPQDCSFLSSFSGLTSLKLPLINNRSGLEAISSCTALQHLAFVRHGASVLDDAECAALAQLTRLTRLEVPPCSDVPGLLSALRCLSGLQSLELPDISSSHLPALASLTKLTSLRGSWVDNSTEPAAAAGGAPATCPSITELWLTGPFPLAAFPGAKEVVMIDTCQPSRLAGLSQHMKALEFLGISESADESTFRSLDPSDPEAERVAALRSLAQLAQLTQLQFALNDDAEAAALGTVTQLQRIMVNVPQGSRVSATGLSSALCRLGKLQAVTIRLPGLQPPQSEAQQLLSSLGSSAVSHAQIFVASRSQRDVWKAAAAAARAGGLPLPARYSIRRHG